MSKKNFNKGIDKIFSATAPTTPTVATVENVENENVTETGKGKNGVVNYNIRYSRALQQRIKRFCIENDEFDMKDVFTQGAEMFINNYNIVK